MLSANDNLLAFTGRQICREPFLFGLRTWLTAGVRVALKDHLLGGSSSPKNSWLKKVAVVMKNTAASNGVRILMFEQRMSNVLIVMGGRRSCLDDAGVTFDAPLRTYTKWVVE
jgi:hypothetical protein